MEFLKQNQRSEYKRHREIYRPQGRCDVVVQTPRFNVNRITVKAGRRVFHADAPPPGRTLGDPLRYRSGDRQRQTVPVDGKSSTFIPIGAEHCLENPGRIPLEVLEIQSGSYLGEDDIIPY